MHSEDFEKQIKNDKDYNKYLNSGWGIVDNAKEKGLSTINTVKGKIVYNSALLGASKFALVASGIGTAYCGLKIITTLISPKLTIFEGISFLIWGAAGYALTKISYKWNKHIKENIEKEEQAEIDEKIEQTKQRKK